MAKPARSMEATAAGRRVNRTATRIRRGRDSPSIDDVSAALSRRFMAAAASVARRLMTVRPSQPPRKRSGWGGATEGHGWEIVHNC